MSDLYGGYGSIADANETPMVDSMDELQPVPRAGKWFGEEVLRGEMTLPEGTIIPGETRPDDFLFDARPRRVRVLQLGPPRDGDAWDFEVGWEAIVPYHAGTRFTWLNQSGVEEVLWILDSQEILALFRPR